MINKHNQQSSSELTIMTMKTSNGFNRLSRDKRFYDDALAHYLGDPCPAIIASQINYWLTRTHSGKFFYQCIDKDGVVVRNAKWARESMKNLHEAFSYWGRGKLRSLINILRKYRILLVADLPKTKQVFHTKMNYFGFDTTGWVTINNNKLDQIYKNSPYVKKYDLVGKNGTKNGLNLRQNEDGSNEPSVSRKSAHSWLISTNGMAHFNKPVVMKSNRRVTKELLLRNQNKESTSSKYVRSSSDKSENQKSNSSENHKMQNSNLVESNHKDNEDHQSSASKPKYISSRTNHPSSSSNPSRQNSEKEKISLEKKDANIFNIQNQDVKHLFHYSDAHKVLVFMSHKCNIRAPKYWLSLFNSLLDTVQPQDIYKAIDCAIQLNRPITSPGGYIHNASVRIAKKRRAKSRKMKVLRHNSYILNKLTNQFVDTLAGSQCNKQDIRSALYAGLHNGTTAKQYAWGIRQLAKHPEVKEPAVFVSTAIHEQKLKQRQK